MINKIWNHNNFSPQVRSSFWMDLLDKQYLRITKQNLKKINKIEIKCTNRTNVVSVPYRGSIWLDLVDLQFLRNHYVSNFAKQYPDPFGSSEGVPQKPPVRPRFFIFFISYFSFIFLFFVSHLSFEYLIP